MTAKLASWQLSAFNGGMLLHMHKLISDKLGCLRKVTYSLSTIWLLAQLLLIFSKPTSASLTRWSRMAHICVSKTYHHCPACRTYETATRFWVMVICPIIKCLTVLEFSFILFDLCLFITIFNFILNYVLIVTFWIFTYHKIWIVLIIYCFIWNYWIIYFLTCLEVFWSVVS